MSVVKHFIFVINQATDNYLCFIGDNDFILYDPVVIASWTKKNNSNAVKLNPAMVYYWLSFQHKAHEDKYSEALHSSTLSSRATKIYAVGAMLDAIRLLGTCVENIPRAYAELVSGRLSKKTAEQYCDLFGGLSPCIYYSAMILSIENNVYAIDQSSILLASSQVSAAGKNALALVRKRHEKRASLNFITDNARPDPKQTLKAI